ncbi:unnamed protein product [Rangifer tarandus platyrhynchus]|uniref:Uncharacterized protein n=2 Tax=Rangifer tarandus platyrhynchus TaxID=3082113 RepID=A0ACB0DYG3_RANTA|nr:unnamed protein product [Rangifer tarandus platyrhynchus]CAI9693111.1 unnamed protein product [Rangifer tarandus platyrhynchus]
MRAADRGVTAPGAPAPAPRGLYARGPGSAVTSAPPPGVWGAGGSAASPEGQPLRQIGDSPSCDPASLPF